MLLRTGSASLCLGFVSANGKLCQISTITWKIGSANNKICQTIVQLSTQGLIRWDAHSLGFYCEFVCLWSRVKIRVFCIQLDPIDANTLKQCDMMRAFKRQFFQSPTYYRKDLRQSSARRDWQLTDWPIRHKPNHILWICLTLPPLAPA